jgi:hypothetical protein
MSNQGTSSEENPGKDPGQDLRFLLDLALDKSLEGRRALTATIGDLFGKQDAVLSERERALMTDILRKLIHDCEMAVRRDLSERLSGAPNPPHELIVALANDEIEVAEPILKRSAVLRDAELVGVIRHRTQQHQLVIAMRRSLSEYVSDALVETGNIDVIKVLLRGCPHFRGHHGISGRGVASCRYLPGAASAARRSGAGAGGADVSLGVRRAAQPHPR